MMGPPLTGLPTSLALSRFHNSTVQLFTCIELITSLRWTFGYAQRLLWYSLPRSYELEPPVANSIIERT